MQRTPQEDRPPQAPEPARLQLQPDQEEHQYDAELGQFKNRLGCIDQPEELRADQHAGYQVSEDRAQAQVARQGNGHHGGAEEDQR